MTRWNPGRPTPRGRCSVCRRDVARTGVGGTAGYHYQHPRGPLNPSGFACRGQGKPTISLEVPMPGSSPTIVTVEHQRLAAAALNVPDAEEAWAAVAAAIADAELRGRADAIAEADYCPGCGASADDPYHRDGCPLDSTNDANDTNSPVDSSAGA